MLCSLCSDIFIHGEQRTEASGAHHSTFHDLQAAAQNRCGVCHILAERMKRQLGDVVEDYTNDPLRYKFRAGEDNVYAENTSLEFRGMGQEVFASISFEMSLFQIALNNEGNGGSSAHPKNFENIIPKGTNTGDSTVALLASRWLKDCLFNHVHCGTTFNDGFEKYRPKAGWYPDRLLDLTDKDPRLLITCLEKPIHTKYATLSYSWGPNPKHLTLTTDNLQDMCKKIPMDALQKTFRDAIQTVRALDIFYIWIDSLCIIQSGEGSKKDWEEQAAAMSEVYSNCTLNISADQAANADEGCFVDRDLELFKSVYFKWKGRDHVLIEDNMSMRLFNTPLWKRGWVVQERLLSPRVLHFGRGQIFWECEDIPFASEIFPGGLNINKVPFNIEIPLIHGRPGVVDWSKIVLQYSKCSLSFPAKDKFMAISAIAERFAELYKDDYVAGLFGSGMALPEQLLWRVADTDEYPASVWTGDYRAPSWSWMSIDGPVDISNLGPFKSPLQAFMSAKALLLDYPSWNFTKVIDLRIELVNPDKKFGPIKSARIVLQGRLFSDEFLEKLKPCWGAECPTGTVEDGSLTMTSIMDSRSSTPDGEMPMLFPIGRGFDIHGLILKQEGDAIKETYSRLGYFQISYGIEGFYYRWREILGAEKIITLI